MTKTTTETTTETTETEAKPEKSKAKAKPEAKVSPIKTFMSDGSDLTLVTDKTNHLYDPRADGPPLDPGLPTSIDRLGWTHGAIKVAPHKDADGHYPVIEGKQRTKSLWIVNAIRAKKGLPPVMALVMAADKEKEGADTPEGHYLQFASLFVGNQHATKEAPLMEAKKVKRLLQLAEEAGVSKSQAMKDAQVILGDASIDTVKNRLRALETPKKAQAEFEAGKITLSDLVRLASLKPENQEAALEKIPRKDPNATTKKGEKRVRRKGQKPGDRVQGEGKRRPTVKHMGRYLEVMGEGHKGAPFLKFAMGLISEQKFQKITGLSL